MTPFNFLVLQYENGEINERELLETMKEEHIDEYESFYMAFVNWVDSITTDKPNILAQKDLDGWQKYLDCPTESTYKFKWENFKYEWYGSYSHQETRDFIRGYFLGGSATKSAYK